MSKPQPKDARPPLDFDLALRSLLHAAASNGAPAADRAALAQAVRDLCVARLCDAAATALPAHVGWGRP